VKALEVIYLGGGGSTVEDWCSFDPDMVRTWEEGIARRDSGFGSFYMY
jgi:hypothetical protein